MGAEGKGGKWELDYEPHVISVEDARSQARGVSSRIFDMMGVDAKATQPGPGISTCSADPNKERMYVVRHPWAIYGVSNSVLKEAMDNLRNSLPGDGWTIVKDGREESKDRQPVIHAENDELQYTLIASWAQGREKPQISVTLTSACIKTPEGENPRGEY
ncbi:hypothetical protein [Streptomyces chitinivorans]|nr:hypothetical protein [Streptomyces chitinivorans]MDH2411899.1 hypothetical protein [Streptomyces chitinivorans]